MSESDLDFIGQMSGEPRAYDYGRPQPPPQGGRGGGRHRGRRRKKKRRGRLLAPLFALVFLGTIIGGGGYYGYTALRGYMFPPDYSGDGTGSVNVQIRKDDSLTQVGDRLKQHDVVKSSRAFVKAAKGKSEATGIQPGFYQMRRQMAAKAALVRLLDPKALADTRLDIPQGWRVSKVLDEMAKRTGIPRKDYQKVVNNPAELGLPNYAKGKVEGYLWPGLYNLDPDGTPVAHLRQMVTKFKKEAEDMDLEAKAKDVKRSPADVITIASLIQAESGRESDMPKIARVIYNRLSEDRHWFNKLQLDSTVMYGLNKYGVVASKRDLEQPNPYSTYQHEGLPPGAIANPGKDSIAAALKPSKGKWVYFVTTDPKRRITKFAETDAEFKKLRKELVDNLANGN